MNQTDLDFIAKKTIDELKEFRVEIDQRIAHLQESARAAAIEQIQQIAAEAGMDLSTLLKTQKTATKVAKTVDGRGKVAPKYRNPSNPTETWTGRGKQPRWIAAALAAGKPLESMLISNPQ